MKLSTKGRYAVMAMVELAAREGRAPAPPAGKRAAPVSLAEIAASQMLSLAYLEQLFGPLRRAGLVASSRGPGGGYRLAHPADLITIAMVCEAVEDNIRTIRCDEESPNCVGGGKCATHDLWAELSEHVRLFMDGLTLADVLAGAITGRAAAPRRRVTLDA